MVELVSHLYQSQTSFVRTPFVRTLFVRTPFIRTPFVRTPFVRIRFVRATFVAPGSSLVLWLLKTIYVWKVVSSNLALFYMGWTAWFHTHWPIWPWIESSSLIFGTTDFTRSKNIETLNPIQCTYFSVICVKIWSKPAKILRATPNFILLIV